MVYEYHVSKKGNDFSKGTKEEPFLTINKAAQHAKAGDTVIVHEGEYREWIKPKYSGLSNQKRITYRAAKDEKVIIKGSERIENWENIEGTIWKTTLPNSFFGDFNPYDEEVMGDWILYDTSDRKHLGDVYLNGMSFYEAKNYEELLKPEEKETVIDNWTQKEVKRVNTSQTKFLWFAEVDQENTTIFANFHGNNPNKELVEINVRKSCFYPDENGIDYITVRGFEFAQAATPWTPPTANQIGMLGPNWSKGWIIEDNILHDAKCSAISIGKEESTGHNEFTLLKDKPGYQYQLESVFRARQIGWSKETVGSHIIRNNEIFDCGQNGVVGHLGCVFSKVHDNHIYNIGIKREFYGHEIGGIKLHAPIDVEIYNNHIHDCSLGLWLDWQTEGTRISKNVFHKNSRDFFVEVSSGPYTVDYNIFGSSVEMDNFAQGGAYINNLFCGHFNIQKVLDRPTPYHFPHSTQVAGFAPVYGGDDRFYNNIFINQDSEAATSHYDGSPVSMKEYIELTQKNKPGDHGLFKDVEQPVYINNNIYLEGVESFNHEKNKLVLNDFNTDVQIIEENNNVYLSINLPEEFDDFKAKVQSTESLVNTRLTKAEFDKPNGQSITFNEDFFNKKTDNFTKAGPIQSLKSGKNKVKIL